MARSRVVDLSNFQQFTAINLLADPGHDPQPKPIPACMEVRINYALEDGKVAHNVLHARYTGGYPGNVALANSLQTAINQAFTNTNLLIYLHTSTQITGVSLRDRGALNTPYVDSSGAAIVGTGTGSALPNEVAACLTQRTAIAGPGGRGRIYIPGFATVALGAGNVIAAATVTGLNNFGNTLRANINAVGGLTMCLALPSRVAYTGSTGTQHAQRPAQTADVASITCRDNHWDSQRRRGLK